MRFPFVAAVLAELTFAPASIDAMQHSLRGARLLLLDINQMRAGRCGSHFKPKRLMSQDFINCVISR